MIRLKKNVDGWVLVHFCLTLYTFCIWMICNELWQNIDNWRPEGWEHDFKEDKALQRSTDKVCVVADERISKGKHNALCRSHCCCICCLSWWQGHTAVTNFLLFLEYKIAPVLLLCGFVYPQTYMNCWHLILERHIVTRTVSGNTNYADVDQFTHHKM